MRKLFFYDHPLFDKIALVEEDEKITNMYIGTTPITEPFIYMETDLIKKAHEQLVEYFNKERESFDFPIALKGTTFQKKVWNVIEKIPYGQVITYQDVAKKIGQEKAYQAVGTALSKNPLPIFVPCHRVINSNGKFGNYKLGLEIKKYLLILEKVEIKEKNQSL